MKEFLENIDRLSKWFPECTSVYTKEGFKYTLPLNHQYNVEVELFVGREPFINDFTMASALWRVRILDGFDLKRTLLIKNQKCLFNYFEDLRVEELGRDDKEHLALFMELIWTDIFMRRIHSHGLITGSWVSGTVLI